MSAKTFTAEDAQAANLVLVGAEKGRQAVHDLVVKNDDLVVGTMGRAIWILDDLTPLRTRPDFKALVAPKEARPAATP